MQEEKDLLKYRQIPLLSFADPCLQITKPAYKDEHTTYCQLGVKYALKTGNDFLVKNAVVKVALQYGEKYDNEVLLVRKLAGIGSGIEMKYANDASVGKEVFLAITEKMRWACQLKKSFPLIVDVTVYYQSMLNLCLRLHRAYGIGECNEQPCNIVQDWYCGLNTPLHYTGDPNYDCIAHWQHFNPHTPDNVEFPLAEFTEDATFAILERSEYEQAISKLLPAGALIARE